MSKYSHLNNEDRSQIETGLINSKSFKEIGEAVGKDCTTIAKEIRSHMVFRKTGAYGRPSTTAPNVRPASFPVRAINARKVSGTPGSAAPVAGVTTIAFCMRRRNALS